MGTVKRVTILHGWSDSTQKWEAVIKLLKEKGFQVELPKIPGLTEKLDTVWTLEDYVRWLNNIIREQTILIGHSNGGRIALAYTLRHPEKVDHLILIDSAGIYHNHLTLRLKRLFFKNIAKIGKILTQAAFLRSLLYRGAGEKDYLKADPILRKTMANMIKVDISSQLPKIETSTLIIWGKEDKTTPLEDGYKLRQGLKNSQLFVVEEARHSPQFTHPEEVVKKITAFLH